MSQTDRYLVVGSSGSGKTVLAGELLDALEARRAFTRLVVLSTDEPKESALAVRCEHHEEISTEVAGRRIDLEGYLRQNGAAGVYFEITALGAGRTAFLEQLGAAIMAVGHVLLVVDEAHSIADRHVGLGFLELWTRGRKRGVTVVAITQSMKQSAAVGVNMTVIRGSSALVVFQVIDPSGHEQEQILRHFPHLGPYLAGLKPPRDGDPPEYGVLHTPTGRASVRLRSGDVDLTTSPTNAGTVPAAVSA